MSETPLYATLLYDVRKTLNISIAEYFYLDMVYHLSYQRWCSKSLAKCADDMGITKVGLLRLRDRLINEGLLEKNDAGELRVTPKYIEIAVNKVYRPKSEQQKSVYKVSRSVNKVYRPGIQSSRITDTRVTIELQENKGTKNLKGSEAPGTAQTPETHNVEGECYKRTIAIAAKLRNKTTAPSPFPLSNEQAVIAGDLASCG